MVVDEQDASLRSIGFDGQGTASRAVTPCCGIFLFINAWAYVGELGDEHVFGFPFQAWQRVVGNQRLQTNKTDATRHNRRSPRSRRSRQSQGHGKCNRAQALPCVRGRRAREPCSWQGRPGATSWIRLMKEFDWRAGYSCKRGLGLSGWMQSSTGSPSPPTSVVGCAAEPRLWAAHVESRKLFLRRRASLSREYCGSPSQRPGCVPGRARGAAGQRRAPHAEDSW